MSGWTIGDSPDLTGRTAVITGANAGVGFETARLLAERGASVVLACRNPHKSAAAAARILDTAPTADIHQVPLDLSSLHSVHTAAATIRANHGRIDLLINNAGTVCTRYAKTGDGFETTFATNYLGPFALTGLLFGRLAAVPGARIVTVSSVTHQRGKIVLDDLHFTRRRYRYMTAYAQSKLASLLFALELHRRASAAGVAVTSLAAHPGSAKTEFSSRMGRLVRISSEAALFAPVLRLVQQSATDGALPTLRAALDPTASGGDYFGPSGRLGLKGRPVRTEPAAAARDNTMGRRLWEETEQLTGVHFAV